jgi:hypothetical protein
LEIGKFKDDEFRPVLVIKIIGSNAILIPITSKANKFNFSIPVHISSRYKNVHLKIGSIRSINIDQKLNLYFLPIHNKGKALYIEEPEVKQLIRKTINKTLLN